MTAPVLAAPARPKARSPLRKTPVAAPERLEVFPNEVRLGSKRATRQLVVTGYFHGAPRDLTSQSAYALGRPSIASVSGGQIRGMTDGQTTLTVSFAGKSLRVPVAMSGAGKPDPVSFKFETLPVLTKQGCAGGSCHGSPHGKGGFALSLFGYDPRLDTVSLTREGFNRRVNVLEPEESLILKKPQLEVPHVGGKKLRKTDAAHAILRGWVFEGANTELPAAEVRSVQVYPSGSRVLHLPHRRQQLSVTARFSDGAERDVTPIATFESSHPDVASVDARGLVTGLKRGQAAISVRYLDRLESLYFTVVEEVPGFAWINPPELNFIDRLVHEKQRQLRYLPSGVATDSVFIRRLYLDLTGLLPPPARVRQFLADARPDKRSKLVDELLETEEYARFWALKKADLMRVNPRRLQNGRAERFGEWLVESLRKNQPYDQFARELLTSAGDTLQVSPANYFLAIPTMEERTEMTAQLFMGSRLECAKCHNHPFEAWTMRDYYSLAAVFARTQSDPKSGQVTLANTGEAVHPSTKETLKPWGSEAASAETDRRAAFASWLTRPGNPYFARVEVNRIWAELLGRGIVDPVDDFRSSNPPSNVALLDALAREFEKSGFDRKHIVRLICNSRTYQLSTETNRFNETDERLFTHARPRLLTAEQLKDAISVATRALPVTPEPAQRSRYATQRPVPEGSAFTAAFGQPQRETACTCERQTSPTLLQALELLNGGTAYRAAVEGADRYQGLEDAVVVEELYLSALARPPSAKERDTALAFLKRGADRKTAVGDLIWALVNTQEFLFQH